MWAPADVFSHGLAIFLDPLKVGATYLYEHPVILALVCLAAALLIAVVTLLRGGRERRGETS